MPNALRVTTGASFDKLRMTLWRAQDDSVAGQDDSVAGQDDNVSASSFDRCGGGFYVGDERAVELGDCGR